MIHIRPVIIIYDSQAASEARRIEHSTEMANVDVESELVTRHEKSRAEHSCWIETTEHETEKKILWARANTSR